MTFYPPVAGVAILVVSVVVQATQMLVDSQQLDIHSKEQLPMLTESS